MKAIKIIARGKAEIQDAPIPALRDDYVLVKVKAVALNPTDWKHIDFGGLAGATSGCDFAGVVEEIGSKVTKAWKKGDRIAGFAHGGNALQLEDGGFAEYLVAKGDLWLKIPDGVSDEDASTLGIGITTVGQALYQSLKLPLPGASTKAGVPLLIYGASTATGTLAVQFARLSGCSSIIATCSPSNFELVKSLGADAVFDYKDPECAAKIRAHTAGAPLGLALDCIGDQASTDVCAAALGPAGGVISSLSAQGKSPRQDVTVQFTLGYMIIGERLKLGPTMDIPGNPDEFEFGKAFWPLAEALLAEGRIRVHPVQVGEGGLEGVFEGLQAMREGKVSGKKLVYRID
ncbi:putative zinc-binding oxidoreductase ToxD [Lasiosphaeria miniovina]|uniref:Zinc-binding oxidoreductase ToxD n=1 Tax=Lasiosphaeria miniovina TaxID=1954250 RepID=A0AA40DXY0_9PEZI|nr:putative zinc-binding oxidoreductase ToxD [Lasiosphaeria miniovina]KAK0717742.1 putative zinc-binding oxidoreductase ToxD [Lasiosphaeria miniovina]